MSDAPLLTHTAGRQKLLATYRDGLLQDTMRFWFPRALDSEQGGFLHCFDRDGALLDSDKSIWAQGRMSWMLLTLFNTVEQRGDWLAWAKGGIDFLNRNGFDTDGRMFFHVTRDGQPIRKRRYAYSEAFAAIANAAYARAAGDGAAAARAHDLFDRFVDWNFTPGKMPPKFTGTRPLTGLAPRMITIVTAQELRANLGASAKLDGWVDRCIEEIERLFLKPGLRVVMECVGPNGEIIDHFDGRTLNPGHAMEGAWFIMHEGKLRGDRRLIKLGCDMLDWMWARGWDEEFGGIFYFRDVFDRPVQEYWHDMKFWWPHNEAIIATLLAYELTGDVKYARWHQLVHDWAHQHFGDTQQGEWFGYLHRDGRVSVPLKGNLWKSFFHHPRMQFYCWQTLLKSELPARRA
ncbi:MAG TPA: AGE family epimerase/isomerase [Verrucomicrobiae bacterium]|jgi:N-acylglucosamine 2-epimerase